MAVDWLSIKTEYIAGNGSYSSLAEKYGVHKSTIANKAGKEGWTEQREQKMREIANECERRVGEKRTEIVAEAANVKANCETLIWKIAEKKLQSLANELPIEEVETGDLRRLQQIYTEMSTSGVSSIAGMAEDDDPLTKALNEIADKLDRGNADADR